MNTSSCTPQEPFVKLEENGKASILNYSLPQNTSYSATAFLSLKIPQDMFKPVPETGFWAELQQKTIEEIIDLLTQDIQSLGSVGIFGNIRILNRLNVVIYDLAFTRNSQKNLLTEDNSRPAPIISYQPVFDYGDDQAYQPIQTINPVFPEIPENPTNPETGTPVKLPPRIIRAYIPLHYIAQMIKDGFIPLLVSNALRDTISTQFVAVEKKSSDIVQEIMIALEMKMSSYLGDYGAGKTIKTFSLLPGERTTISVRTYQN